MRIAPFLRRPVLLFLSCLLLGACQNSGTTELIDGLSSYQSRQEVRKQLDASGAGNWSEDRNTVLPSDPRPKHDLVTLSGHFRHLGQDGLLRLTFFNDRLMTAEFFPIDGSVYLSALRKQARGFPTGPKEQTVLSRRTSFSYYADPGGNMRFVWEDPKLAKDWQDWVRVNS